MKNLEKNCLICSKSFEKPTWISLKNWNETRKYCSKNCLAKSKIGNTNRLGISYPAWNKGLSGPKGKLSPSWKGNKVGYSGVHKWVESLKGKPNKCEHCLESGFIKQQIHWANIDHKYKRNLNDWIRLCTQCHYDYDKFKKLR